MPHQMLVTIRAPVQQGRESEVSALLAVLRKEVERDGGPFAQMAGLHFARVFLLPGDSELGVPDTLVYLGEVDAPLRDHLHDVMGGAAAPLSALFAQCAGYPERGPLADRVRWAREHLVDAAASYVHRVGRSLAQIRAEEGLRAEIGRFLDDPAQDWATASPVDVHRAVRELVRRRPDLAWALRPPAGAGVLFRAGETLHAVGWAAVLLPLSPLLLSLLPGWLLLVRRLERRDVPETGMPSRDRVAELTSGEDFGTSNPFTAYGRVKPGVVRRVTIGVALRGLDYASRHVFNRDNLAGLRSIHFARWVLLDGGRRVVFASNYDGSQESYMDDFIDRLAWGVNLVFSNGVGFPRTRWLVLDGARNEQQYKAYLRNHQLPSVWFSAYPAMSARNIDDNTLLRNGLSRDLNDEEARSWLALL
jgi:hypothetical protein